MVFSSGLDYSSLVDHRCGTVDARGIDPQLERAVEEALRMLEKEVMPKVVPPPFSRPAAPSEKR